MGITAVKPSTISPEEYLEREHGASTKHEFVNGAIYAMAGANARYNLVAGNLFAALYAHLSGRCAVFMTDMKLRIKLDAATVFYYPDIVVSCAKIEETASFCEQPILLCEVLSPATERIDRTEKFDAYRSIPTLEEYVLADQDTPTVEVFRRRTSWKRETFFLEDRVTFESVKLEIPVTAIYRRLSFGVLPE